MSKEAMKLALKALEVATTPFARDRQEVLMAQAALREALAEQPAQQEPVAWVCEGSSSDEKHAIDYWPGDIEDIPIGTKLYTSPPAQQGPVAGVVLREGLPTLLQDRNIKSTDQRLYTSPQPAQRTWVGLSEQELESLWYQSEAGGAMLMRFADSIEAKLKEKNT